MKRYIIVGWSSCQNWYKSADNGQATYYGCPMKYSPSSKKSVSHKGGRQNYQHCKSVGTVNLPLKREVYFSPVASCAHVPP